MTPKTLTSPHIPQHLSPPSNQMKHTTHHPSSPAGSLISDKSLRFSFKYTLIHIHHECSLLASRKKVRQRGPANSHSQQKDAPSSLRSSFLKRRLNSKGKAARARKIHMKAARVCSKRSAQNCYANHQAKLHQANKHTLLRFSTPVHKTIISSETY